MTTKDKLRKMVDLLYKRTTEKKINWASNGANEVVSRIGGRVLCLTIGKNEDREPLEIVRVLDDAGTVVDYFDDELFKGDRPEVALQFPTYFHMMTETRELAIRQAAGADDALDSILEELDEDPDWL